MTNLATLSSLHYEAGDTISKLEQCLLEEDKAKHLAALQALEAEITKLVKKL